MKFLKRVWDRAENDNLGLLAAGVGFYAILAIFPSLIALVTVYGLVADPAKVTAQVQPVTALLPGEGAKIVLDQLYAITHASHRGLTIGLIFSVLAALWAASGGVEALLTGINAVWRCQVQRSYVRTKAEAIVLTIGAIVVAVIALLLVAGFPAVMRAMHLGGAARVTAEVLRWVLLAGLIGCALSVFYHLCARQARMTHTWFSRGALVALALWLLVSAGFSLFVEMFSSYNKTYGALAGVIVLMMWMYLSAYVVLLGAEVDAELTNQ